MDALSFEKNNRSELDSNKDGESKRTRFSRSLFDENRVVWRAMSRFMDLVYISLLTLLFSLPLLTLCPAFSAAYDTVVHCIRREEPGLLARFWEIFKRELKTGIIASVISIVLFGLWGLLVYAALPRLAEGGGILFMADAIVAGIIVWGIAVWFTPILSRFEMGAAAALRASLKLTLAHIGKTLLLVAALLFTAAASVIWLFPMLVLPGLYFLTASYFLEPVFFKLSQESVSV